MTRMSLLMSVSLVVVPAAAVAQSPKAATYITDEEVKKVNALPGVDRQIVSVDIGKLNEAIGIVHRGPTGTGATGAGGARGPHAPGLFHPRAARTTDTQVSAWRERRRAVRCATS